MVNLIYLCVNDNMSVVVLCNTLIPQCHVGLIVSFVVVGILCGVVVCNLESFYFDFFVTIEVGCLTFL